MAGQDQAVSLVTGAIGARKTSALGYTNPYGAQCIALDAWYLEQLGYKTAIMPGYNAIDVWTKNPLNMEKVGSPQPGDIFFANQKGPDGFNYGHTGIVVEVAATGFYSIDQNWINANIDANGGSPAAKVFHRFGFAVGYLRPDFNKGGDMPAKTTLDTARILAHGVLARNGLAGRSDALTGTSDADLANHTNIDLTNEYVQELFLSDEGRQWRDTQDANSIQGINARLKDGANASAAATAALNTANNSIAQLTTDKKNLSSLLDKATATSADLDTKLKAVQADADATAHERDDLRTQVATVQSELNAANDTITKLKAEAEKPPAPSAPQTNNPPIDTPTPQTQTTTTWLDALLRALRIKK